MEIKTKGLIIREQAIGESDRLITILTHNEGVIRAFARRAKSIRDSKNSATQLFSYSRFKIHKGRDKYIVSEAFPMELFFGLRNDISRLALAQYFCELVASMVPEEIPSQEYLRLMLNLLHFLCIGNRYPLTLKIIAELKLLSLSGYMPHLIGCMHCGEYEAEQMRFIISQGTLICSSCSGDSGILLSAGALRAMRHIVYSDFKKIFSFHISVHTADSLAQISEGYVKSTLGHGFKTLDFFNSLQ